MSVYFKPQQKNSLNDQNYDAIEEKSQGDKYLKWKVFQLQRGFYFSILYDWFYIYIYNHRMWRS